MEWQGRQGGRRDDTLLLFPTHILCAVDLDAIRLTPAPHPALYTAAHLPTLPPPLHIFSRPCS